MISVRMRNMTFRSTCSAEKKVAFRWRQSPSRIWRSAACSIAGRSRSISSALAR
ncbi:hypothetical protein D3C83_271790 [compost metagenome]